MPTFVQNIRHVPTDWKTNPQFVYIGRRGHGLDGPFGNPFPLHDERDRDAVLDQYREWLWRQLRSNRAFATAVAALHGKTLVCFCAPKACHGDVLAAAANWLQTNQP